MSLYLLIGAGFGILFIVCLVAALFLRRVVPANMVHIVQSGRSTISYGSNAAGEKATNSYYAWPSWIPVLGVSVSTFPLSNFDIKLRDYEGYDRGRLPFLVDVMAFFRIVDSNKAAQRVSSFAELTEQLTGILQGAVRRVLATNDLEHTMQDRAKIGSEFTQEVDAQLAEWGVQTVKSIEFMDIRDTATSKVIHNIMSKEQSRIDRESRVAVAENTQQAATAEVESRKAIELSQQDAEQFVGIRTAEKDKAVGIALQNSQQEILEASKATTERSKEVDRINAVRTAEIEKDRAIVAAETYHETTTRNAAADLAATEKRAAGTVAVGRAEGEAETARLLAPVTAQTTLATEIGSNESYQRYLVTVRQVEAGQIVGVAMAEAMGRADLKVIANGGDIGGGMSNLSSMLSSAGGMNIGAMLTALSQTPEGEKLLGAVTGRIAPPEKVVLTEDAPAVENSSVEEA